MKKIYDGCSYSAYGELVCPNNLPKTHGPTPDSLDVVERFTNSFEKQPGWITQCHKNNAEHDMLSKGFPAASTQWQNKGKSNPGNVNEALQANLSSPMCIYNAEGRVICGIY